MTPRPIDNRHQECENEQTSHDRELCVTADSSDGDERPLIGPCCDHLFADQIMRGLPVKVLMMVPDPRNSVQLGLREEFNTMTNELRLSAIGQRWLTDRAPGCRISEITRMLDEQEPDILHISGHGNKEAFCFEDDSGRAVDVEKQALSRVLASFPQLKLVILSCCYSDSQAQVMAEAVGNVIGMGGAVDDADAIPFTREFYRAFGMGMSLGKATNRAKNTVKMTSPSFKAKLFTRKPKSRVSRVTRSRGHARPSFVVVRMLRYLCGIAAVTAILLVLAAAHTPGRGQFQRIFDPHHVEERATRCMP